LSFCPNCLYFGHDAFHVTPPHVETDDDAALAVFPADLRKAGFEGDVRHLFERYLAARRQGDVQVFQVADVLPAVVLEAHDEVEPLFAFINHARFFARKARADDLVEVADVQAVERQLVLVVLDRDLRQAGNGLRSGIFHALHTFCIIGMACSARPAKRSMSSPKIFDGHIAANPGHQFVETHLDGLGELGGHAGNVVEGVLPFSTSFPLWCLRKSTPICPSG
jgi:hypothetical protein